jgi:hypothetical protein
MNAPRILRVGEEFPPMTPAPPPRLHGGKPKGPPADAKAKTGDRFSTINAFLDFSMVGLRPCERAVWLLLWRDTKPDGLARISQADLARRADASIRAVNVAVRELTRRGLLVVVHRGG